MHRLDAGEMRIDLAMRTADCVSQVLRSADFEVFGPAGPSFFLVKSQVTRVKNLQLASG